MSFRTKWPLSFPIYCCRKLPGSVASGTGRSAAWRGVVASLAASLAALTSGFVGAQDAATGQRDRTICRIDDLTIRQSDWRVLADALAPTLPLDPDRPQTRHAITLQLIRQRLASQTLSRRGGEALKRLVKRQLARQAATAAAQGQSFEATWLDRWQIRWSAYLRSRLTEANLKRFFAAEPARYDGTQWRVSHLFREPSRPESSDSLSLSELATQLRAAEEPAAAFTAAVRKHSQAASAERGGELGWVAATGDLPPAVSDALPRAQAGDLIGPIDSPLGRHLLFIHQRRPGTWDFESLPDRATLRRDASDALFEALVRAAGPVEIEWIDNDFQLPGSVAILPASTPRDKVAPPSAPSKPAGGTKRDSGTGDQ